MRHMLTGFMLVLLVSCAPKQTPQTTESEPLPVAIEHFTVSEPIEIGNGPHGMWRYGDMLAIAVSGDDKIVLVDLKDHTVQTTIPALNTPLDVRPAPGGGFWVARFRGETIVRLNKKGEILQTIETGKSPSLFSGGGRVDRWSVVSEFADQLTVFDPASGALLQAVSIGKRPYPAAVLKDGSIAFIPLRGENAIQVYDLINDRELAHIGNCAEPEGGDLSADEGWYLAACNDVVLWINTKNCEDTSRTEGIGPRPFSVLTGKDGRFAYVNNAGSNTVSVIDVATRKIIGELITGKQPIVMREFDGKVYVTNEISGTLNIITPPSR